MNLTHSKLFIYKNLLVQNLPEMHEFGSVKMALISRQLNNIDRPIGNVLLKDSFIPFDVEGGNYNVI